MKPNVAKALLVSKVLIADGMMQEEERTFLDQLMTKLGLTAEERLGVIDLRGLDSAEPFVRALPLDERQALLELLVDAASADGKLSPHELAMVKRLTAALGL
jgi:uncharacterized tellurite resistance protein B-like protein